MEVIKHASTCEANYCSSDCDCDPDYCSCDLDGFTII